MEELGLKIIEWSRTQGVGYQLYANPMAPLSDQTQIKMIDIYDISYLLTVPYGSFEIHDREV